MASVRYVTCEKCKKKQRITSNDVRIGGLPTNLPFTSPVRYFYNCKHCSHENGLWPDEVPK